MTKNNLKLVEQKNVDDNKKKALAAALSQIDKQFGKSTYEVVQEQGIAHYNEACRGIASARVPSCPPVPPTRPIRYDTWPGSAATPSQRPCDRVQQQ